MSMCYLNGTEYQISRKAIAEYIKTWSHPFTSEEIKKIVDEVCFRMDSLEVGGSDVQEFNCIEDAYTDAAVCYIFAHNYSVQALLDEEDDGEIFKYMGWGKPEPEYDDED